MFNIYPKAKKAAAILLPKQHIFLLSHMRSYTSLFSHIMGSNRAICGYYEMHIGYYSWRSLIRQKLLFFENEEPKPGFSYMFDHVLHNGRYGDTSERIGTGRIADEGTSEYTSFQHDAQLLHSAVCSHDRVRKLLIEKSARHSITE